MSTTRIGVYGGAVGPLGSLAGKSPALSDATAFAVSDFALWQPGYEGAVVTVYIAGTTTKATLYSDYALTTEIVNPQVLLSQTIGGVSYGKFAQNVYTNSSYTLDMSTGDQTPVQRLPLSSLKGVDASDAVVTAIGGSRSRSLKSRFADWINVEDYGYFRTTSHSSASSAENGETLSLAIGAASAQGGGVVLLPPGRYVVDKYALPARVGLVGSGEDVTIIECQAADAITTLTGDHAFMADLTVDGVNLTSGSLAVDSKGNDYFWTDRVKLKRTETGVRAKGGSGWRLKDTSVDNTVYGARFLGDLDASNGADGDEFKGLVWRGGKVSTTTSVAIELSVVDASVRHNRIEDVLVSTNIGLDGILLYGAQFTEFCSVRVENNINSFRIADNPDTTVTNRKVNNFNWRGGHVIDGTVKFDGLCQDVRFQGVLFSDVSYEFNVPDNDIVFEDCVEEGENSSDGDTTKLVRLDVTDTGRVVGATTSATPVVAWKRTLSPGEVVTITATASAKQVNAEDYGTFISAWTARCDSADLAYDEQSTNFTVGDIITGASSQTTARLVAQSDSGATGTLSLIDIEGDLGFIDNELLSSDSGGDGRVNGSITYNNASVGTETVIHEDLSAGASAWDIAAAVSGREVQVTVAGAASDTIRWAVKVEEVK